MLTNDRIIYFSSFSFERILHLHCLKKLDRRMPENNLYIKTPLLHSKPLSDIVKRPVYVKLENCQVSHSFKLRGFSQACLQKLKEGYTGFVTTSAGNGGLALAYTANLLDKPCHIFMPSFSSQRMVNRIASYGAHVHVAGTGKECSEKAVGMAKGNSDWAFIDPHKDPHIWDGYSVIVDEIKQDLPPGVKPSCFVNSVGGGGLLTGILKGIEKAGWKDVPVVAMETFGAHNLNKSLAAGRLIENNPMTSVAKTLGAPFVTETVMTMTKEFNVISHVLPDKDAVDACLRFADDHMFLVEPAAGVSLATVYSNVLPSLLKDPSDGPVIIFVCGGTDVTYETLLSYSKELQTQ